MFCVAEMAERFHHVTVLQTHFCDWQWAWQRRQSWHARHARVQALGGRVALRRAFTLWRRCILSALRPVRRRPGQRGPSRLYEGQGTRQHY